MFTVILLSASARQRLGRWEPLFQPFADKVAFCEWNPSPAADSISTAAPDLIDTLDGRRKWRAIVVDTAVEDGRELPDPENPFDYKPHDESGVPPGQLKLEHSPHAMVRLSHLLLGYPDMGAKGFAPQVSYWDPEANTTVYETPPDEASTPEALSAALDGYRARLVTHSDVQVTYAMVDYTDDEKAQHDALSAHYRLQHPRPSQVLFVASRIPVEANLARDLHRAWDEDIDTGPSRFVERNDYSPSSRFAVCPLPAPGHSTFDREELNFWLSILTLAINNLPASALQAERLYRVSLEFNDETLTNILNDHLSRLSAARDALDKKIRRPDRPNYQRISEVLHQQVIPIDFDDLDANSVSISSSGFALIPPSASSDGGIWNDRVVSLRTNVDSYVRHPRRVLARAVNTTRLQTNTFRGERDVLDEIEKDELSDEIIKRTTELAQPATAEILDRTRLDELLSDNDQKVRMALASRLHLGTVLAALAVVVVTWMVAMAPFMYQSITAGGSQGQLAVLITAIAILVCVACSFIVLLFFRLRIRSLVLRMNRDLTTFTSRVKNGASAFSAFLSDLVTYMHGQALLHATSEYNTSLKVTKHHLEEVRRKVSDQIETEKRILREIGKAPEIESSTWHLSSLSDDNFESLMQIFQWPTGARQLELNSSGDKLTSPYDFLSRLNVSDLNFRERHPQAPSLAENSSGDSR